MVILCFGGYWGIFPDFDLLHELINICSSLMLQEDISPFCVVAANDSYTVLVSLLKTKT